MREKRLTLLPTVEGCEENALPFYLRSKDVRKMPYPSTFSRRMREKHSTLLLTVEGCEENALSFYRRSKDVRVNVGAERINE